MSNIEKITIEDKNSNTTRYRSPLLRVQKRNAIKKQSSAKNLISNNFAQTIDFGNNNKKKNNLHKKVDLKIKNLINKNPLNKSQSVTNYNNYCLKAKKCPKNKSPIRRNNNNLSKLEKKNKTLDIPVNYNKFISKNKNKNKANNQNNNKDKNKDNIRKFSLPEKRRINKEEAKLKIKNDYYCINCYNRKLIPNNKEKNSIKNLNNSFDVNCYHKTLELKRLDEDYINKKILKNQERQLMAFNLLKKEKDKNPKSITEKLQYINENEDNPFIGFNLQEYLYYKNKNKNEILNKTIINNINSYKFEKPRKAVKDYYKNVQFQIPVLEKRFGPNDNYKNKYIETLKKQINDKEKAKKEMKKLKIKTEMEEDKVYNEFLEKLKKDEKEKKKLKQKIMYENNKNLEEFQKKRNEEKKKETIAGGDDKFKKYNENQKDYKYFINQQRINEINSLQKWINENMKQKRKKIDIENRDDKKWVDYNNKFNKSFNDKTYNEKCVDCNASCPINKLYELPKK